MMDLDGHCTCCRFKFQLRNTELAIPLLWVVSTKQAYTFLRGNITLFLNVAQDLTLRDGPGKVFRSRSYFPGIPSKTCRSRRDSWKTVF